jgi:hypothetical protein
MRTSTSDPFAWSAPKRSTGAGAVFLGLALLIAALVATSAWALMLIVGIFHGTIMPETVTGTLSFWQSLGLISLLKLLALKYEKSEK